MKKIALLFLLFFVFFSCKIQDSKKQTLVRFKIGSIDKVEGVGFFDINKTVLYYSNGILYPFLDCYTVLQNNENMTVINTKGKEIFQYKTDPIMTWSYSEGYFSSYWEHDGVDVYNTKGKIVNINTSRPVKNGYYVNYNSHNRNMYYVTPKGQFLKNKNDDIYYSEYCGDFTDGYAIVRDDSFYGVINLFAEEIIEKKFSFIENLKYGYATASIKGTKDEYKNKNNPKYGLINMKGDWVIEPEYYEIKAISKEKAVLKTTPIENEENCGWGIINLENKKIRNLDPKIYLRSDFETGNIFFENEAIFSYSDKMNKLGIINSEGEILLNAICEKIEPNPDDGYWQVLIDNRWMLFTAEHGIINPEEYLDFSKVK